MSRCLASAVLNRFPEWLGRPSPSDLYALLSGAAWRADIERIRVPSWRIFGPLEDPDFYLPIVARTGHPTLNIKWATALELIYLDLNEAMGELRSALEEWEESFETQVLPEEDTSELPWIPMGIRETLADLARRPGLYIGSADGWTLRCFLTGMSQGAEWLSIPESPELTRIIREIEATSMRSYGSPFGAYRIYSQDPATLLSWAGIGPKR